MDRGINSNSARSQEPDSSPVGSSRYVDDTWIIHDRIGNDTYEIDFNSRFGELTGWQKQLAKNAAYIRCAQFNGRFVAASGLLAVRKFVAVLSTIFHTFNQKYPGLVLGDLSEEDLTNISIRNSDGSLSSYKTARARVMMLWSFFDLQHGGSCFVSENLLPSHDVSQNWEDLAAIQVEMSGRSFAEWRAGGTFDIVPFEVSLAILSYCIDLIRCDETKYLLAWFQAQRRWRDSNGTLPHHQVVSRVQLNFGGPYGPAAHPARAWDAALFNELLKFYPHATSHDDLPIKPFPFRLGRSSKSGELETVREAADHLLAACFVAMIILTGMRQSEARTMSSGAVKRNGSSLIFTSGIYKTNHGIETERGVASIVADFVEVLDGLGGCSLADERRPHLFSYLRESYSYHGSTLFTLANDKGAAWRKVVEFYGKFLESQSEDMREICPHVTPHGFRHTWAEFAMRRFDGNIMPLIRDHFRHWFGSTMTGVYTHNKIEMSEYQELGKRQIFELVSRYIDGAAALYGQLGEFLTARVDEIDFIEMHDIQARDAAIEQIIEEHIGDPIITPHEYGLCVLREHTKSLANCRDENGIPQTETADISNCAGCVNSCMVKQLDGKEDTHLLELQRQLEVYKRQVETWQDDELLGPLFLDEARKTFRAIQAVKKKMEAGNE